MKTQKTSQRGFTLLEVLIAIIISTIGLLGIAKLQLVTLKNNSGSQFRSIAIQLASDTMERMRGNQTGVNSGFYNLATTSPADARYATPVATCTDSSGSCTPQERAQTDAAEIMAQAKRALPNGVIVVCIDSGSGGIPSFNGATINAECDGLGTSHAVKVFWLDDRNNKATTLAAGNYAAFVTRGTP
jgi:type IV pilus assembly protein PilV